MLVFVCTSRLTMNSLPTMPNSSDIAKNPIIAGTVCIPSATYIEPNVARHSPVGVIPIVPIRSPIKPDNNVFGTFADEERTAKMLTPIIAIKNISVGPILIASRAIGTMANNIKM